MSLDTSKNETKSIHCWRVLFPVSTAAIIYYWCVQGHFAAQ